MKILLKAFEALLVISSICMRSIIIYYHYAKHCYDAKYFYCLI